MITHSDDIPSYRQATIAETKPNTQILESYAMHGTHDLDVKVIAFEIAVQPDSFSVSA